MLENSIKNLLSLSQNGHLQMISINQCIDQLVNVAIVDNKDIIEAFNRSQEDGLLSLVVTTEIMHWPKALVYWREFIAIYITELCNLPSEFSLEVATIDLPKQEVLEQMVNKIPPMPGAEYCNITILQSIWKNFDAWIFKKMQGMNIEEFLSKYLPNWRQVGKICFHLAENKADLAYPFAFIATYAKKLINNSKIQYQPLSHALQEYAGYLNKKVLTNLLQPIYAAGKKSEWLQDLIESRDLYHALAWQPQEAYKLLQHVSLLEEAGILVKLPNWWKKRPKAKVQVSIGKVNNSSFTVDDLLQINLTIAVGDYSLTEEEIQQIFASEDGLLFIRGQWVEIDKVKLQATLAHWKSIQRQAANGKITFIEGMRLLAGASNNLEVIDDFDEQNSWVHIQSSDQLKEIIAKLKNPENIKNYYSDQLLAARLRNYQIIGVNWLCFLVDLGLGACLADDMGLGKTIQIIALLVVRKQIKKNIVPSMLVLPASLLSNWQNEIIRFAPFLRVLCLHPSELSNNRLDEYANTITNQGSNFDLIITTYGTLLRQEWLQEQRWDLIILDEAQAIKNPMAKQTRAVKKLKGKARIVLTGTPVENRLGDLWSIFDFICPGLLGSATKFKSFVKDLSKKNNLSFAPLRKLVQPYILRRLKTDKTIINDLPDKIEMIAWCYLTKEQAKLYLSTVSELSKALKNTNTSINRKGLILSYLLKFKQICNHPSQFLMDGEYITTFSGKFMRLREICDEIHSRQEKVLIFTQYAEIIVPISKLLQDLFGQPGLILHGGTPIKKRQQLVHKFQQEQSNPFFILSLKAGGTGLNLTAARHVIHFDRWWNPAVENQATDRAYRIGQKNNVLVHKFICKGTFEEKIDLIISSKSRLANDILSTGNEALFTELNDQEIIDLISLDINTIQV